MCGMEDESSDEDDGSSPLYKVGDRIRNVHNLHGVVTKCEGGRYDVEYNDGQVDWSMRQSMLRPPAARSRKSRTTAGSWSTQEVVNDLLLAVAVAAMLVIVV